MTSVATIGEVQDSNLLCLLELLQTQEDISRQDLAELSGLSPAGVSKLVAILIERGLVREDALLTRGRGRRAIGLRLNENAMYAVGVRLARHCVKCGVFNVRGQLLHHQERNVQGESVTDTIAWIKLLIRQSLVAVEDAWDKTVGIGISAPGPLHADAGEIIFISNSPGWRNVALAPIIEAEFGLRTFVEQDANASALAERWFGQGKDSSDLVYVAAGRGVGAGVLIDGKLYRGSQSAAGEIGHTSIAHDGPQCDCGNRGCLEMYCSGLSLIRQANELASERGLSGWPTPEDMSVEAIVRLAEAGDAHARDLIITSGRHMGVGLVNLINSYNPDTIILGDEMASAGSLWLSAIEAVVAKRVVPAIRDSTRIVLSELPIDPAFLGAGALVMKRAFANLSQVRSAGRVRFAKR